MLATALPQSPPRADPPNSALVGALSFWNACSPLGTPPEVAAISAAVAALQDPAVQAAAGGTGLGSTPQQRRAVEAATAAWMAFVRDYGIAQGDGHAVAHAPSHLQGESP
ncbi:hypothetical protein [Ottowia sp.]|uniref:hypothetical protein n=1 Tax=Ottowia sp. TaxID=1898956 RepID=UPI003936A8B4